MTAELIVSRHGDNIFVAGLRGRGDAVHLVPALTTADRAVDRRGTRYIHAETYGRHGIRIEIRCRRNDGVVRRVTSRYAIARIALA